MTRATHGREAIISWVLDVRVTTGDRMGIGGYYMVTQRDVFQLGLSLVMLDVPPNNIFYLERILDLLCYAFLQSYFQYKL